VRPLRAVEPPLYFTACLDPGGVAYGGPSPGSPDGRLGTVLTRAGPGAASLSRWCTGCPEVFNVPQGLARCSRVRARACGSSRSLAVGAQGPGVSAPVTGPFLRTGRMLLVLSAGRPRASGAGRGPRHGVFLFFFFFFFFFFFVGWKPLLTARSNLMGLPPARGKDLLARALHSGDEGKCC